MSQAISTITKLLDLYQDSKEKGEKARLSMETRDGKEFVSFSIGMPLSAGTPAGRSRCWPTTRSRKTPSQIRRDQRRKEAFLAKKRDAENETSVDAAASEVVQLEEIEKEENKSDVTSYEMLFDAPNCSDKEIEECFNFNFEDELKSSEIEKDNTVYKFEPKDSKLVFKKYGDQYKSLKTFVVEVRNNEEVKKIMDVFLDTVNFDPACFKGAIRNEKQANLREVKKL